MLRLTPQLTSHRSTLPIHTRRCPASAPSARAVRRFLERRRARELGYELPLNTREAAAYVGLDRKTVERMARNGEIPVQPASGVRRNTWKFYASELDVWLGEAVLGGTKCLPK
jgi:excisionase family DNA binding protein